MGDDAAGPLRSKDIRVPVRKWKRVETANGPRFRSALAAHEAALLKNLVSAMIGLLDERESSSPPDELEEITGIKTGNSERPDGSDAAPAAAGFLQTRRPTTEDSAPIPDSLNAALRSLHEPEIIDAKRVAAQQLLDTVPENGGRFELTEEAANAWIAAVNDSADPGRDARDRPARPGTPARDHPLAAHFDVYQWLTVLQEYLVLVLMGPDDRIDGG